MVNIELKHHINIAIINFELSMQRRLTHYTVLKQLTRFYFIFSFTQGDLSGWTVQLGITRRHAHSYFGQKMKIKRVVPHPMYNQGVAHDNDVALFQVNTCYSLTGRAERCLMFSLGSVATACCDRSS